MSGLKSQIGHPQARVCGAAGIAATLIAMQHNQIPPTINLEKPDPDCDLDYVPDVGRAGRRSSMLCVTASLSDRKTQRWCCGE